MGRAQPTTYIGTQAESRAADYLQQQGYEIVDRNWRRRECEIDIVASKQGRLHFVEVKYRHSVAAGSGLEYITVGKLRRMSYAAERWVAAHAWGGEYVLAAIELDGDDFAVTAFIDCIE
jgi:putative endonuclease